MGCPGQGTPPEARLEFLSGGFPYRALLGWPAVPSQALMGLSFLWSTQHNTILGLLMLVALTHITTHLGWGDFLAGEHYQPTWGFDVPSYTYHTRSQPIWLVQRCMRCIKLQLILGLYLWACIYSSFCLPWRAWPAAQPVPTLAQFIVLRLNDLHGFHH